MIYDQTQVVQKLNQYLQKQQRSQILTHGYCHGLTLLWLYQMSIGQEKWFYDTIRKICHGSEKRIFNKFKIFGEKQKKESKDIERFLSFIEWFQKPEAYMPSFRQMDIENTTEKKIALRFSGVYSKNELQNILKMMIAPNQMIIISSPSHSIGIFQREKNYYIYNSNDVSGMAKKVTAFAALQEKILKNLYEFSESSSYFALIIHRIGENFLKMKRKKLMAMISHQKNYVKRLDAENLNPLYLATESHDDKLVKWLLKQNAPPNVATLDGRLPLLHASYSGYQKIVKSLLEYGAEPDLEGREGLPLFVASLEGHLNVVKTLFNFGADINKADRDGETALFAAIENSHVDIIQFLLKKGADVQWQRKNGDTPLDLAIAQKKWGIVEMLKKNHYSPRFFDSANDYSISPNPALIPISL